MASSSTGFFQSPPRLGNQYLEDSDLRALLERVVPPAFLEQIQGDLVAFGWKVANEIHQWGIQCETSPPTLQQFDAWGRRIDNIIASDAWKKLGDEAAKEGLVAIGYERKFGQWSRFYQYVKLYLFAPSTIFTCPLAMTDGASRVLELYGDRNMKETIFKRLTSRDPTAFATSGQWMTERTGGSDVSNTETIAIRDPNGGEKDYLLTGYKFFTSATTGQFALGLARIQDSTGKAADKLSVFAIPVRDDVGNLNNISVVKLKNKLGTKGVPTAELELKNTKATLVGEEGKGVAQISSQFNITRIHNAISAIGFMRRGIAVARDFAFRRKAFGKSLSEQPLHLKTLSDLEVLFRGNLQFVFRTVHLLGISETQAVDKSESERAEKLLRLLTPVVKLFTAKQAVTITSEAIECLGGTGYMEDSHMPVLLRDAQVLPIWEGTTTVLSLDVLRVLIRTPESFTAYHEDIKLRLSSITSSGSPPVLLGLKQVIQEAATKTLGFTKRFSEAASSSPSELQEIEAGAREFSMDLGRIYAAALLAEHAAWSESPVDREAALRWVIAHGIINTTSHTALCSQPSRKLDRALAMDLDPNTGAPRGVGDQDPSGRPRAKF